MFFLNRDTHRNIASWISAKSEIQNGVKAIKFEIEYEF